MKLSLNLCVVSLLMSSGLMGAASATISLERPDGKMEEVKSPFEYRHLSDEDRAHSVFVPESFYTVLGNDSPLTSAVVGPLCPCFLVAVRYEPQDKAVVFHMNDGNSADRVMEVLEREFGKELNTTQLQVKLFTKSVKGLPPMVLEQLQTSVEAQRALYMSVFTGLNKKYGLKKEQVSARIFSGAFPQEYTFYFEADKSVFIDKDLNIFCISLLAEEIFAKCPADLTQLVLAARLISSGYDRILTFYMGKYLRGVVPVPSVPFGCIPVHEVGLAKVRV